MNPLSDRAHQALEILGDAGQLARQWFDAGDYATETKSDGSPVTDADRDVETLLRSRLSTSFPADGILGEEFEETMGTSGNRWIIDPIDGTKSFVRAVPLYATLLAYEEEGEVTFGAIALPSLSITVYAERGAGCWSNGRLVHVSDHGVLKDSYVMATWLENWSPQLLEMAHDRGVTVRTWGDAYGYSLVATGKADALIDFDAKVYDLAPMSVILEEAGGRFTSLDGAPGNDQGHGIASNGLIHETLIQLIERNG